jgi:hypothetical protein
MTPPPRKPARELGRSAIEVSVNETITFALFSILFGMALVWLVLVKLLFRRLERNHPEKYVDMGRPSLFMRNNLSGGIAMLKFLAMREHRKLDDGFLSKLSNGMLVFFAVYIVLFLTLFCSFL